MYIHEFQYLSKHASDPDYCREKIVCNYLKSSRKTALRYNTPHSHVQVSKPVTDCTKGYLNIATEGIETVQPGKSLNSEVFIKLKRSNVCHDAAILRRLSV